MKTRQALPEKIRMKFYLKKNTFFKLVLYNYAIYYYKYGTVYNEKSCVVFLL